MVNVPPSIYSAVEPYSLQNSVPDAIWEDVVQIESGFNPNAVGDQGTSFGLFQLHKGGQLPAGMTAQQAFDPATNASIAMPRLGAAWSNLYSTFNPTDINWWEQFAAQSGHPGGSPGQQTTDAEASRLLANYNSSVSTSGNGQQSLTASTGGCTFPCVSFLGGCYDLTNYGLPCPASGTSGTPTGTVVDSTGSALTGPGSVLAALTDKNTWISVGLVSAGILVAVVGLYALLGGTPQKAAGSAKKAAMVAAI